MTKNRLLEWGLRYFVMLIELVITIMIGATLVIAAYKALYYINEFTRSSGFDKHLYLEILDIILLSVLAVDLMRTLVIAIIKRTLPISIVIEVSILAVLREIIAIEIRNPDTERILVYGVLIVILVSSWLAIQWFRYKVEGRPVNMD